MIIIGLLAVFIVVFAFAACNVAHKYDEVDNELIKMLMCQDAQEICDQDCDHCAWGKGDVKE